LVVELSFDCKPVFYSDSFWLDCVESILLLRTLGRIHSWNPVDYYCL